MPVCVDCGIEILRTRRNLAQRLYSHAAFKCPKCESRIYQRRRFLALFGRYTQCPKCGSCKVSRLKSIDHIDQMNKNPLRLLLRVFGAPLYHCTFCRLQFWDVRARQPSTRTPERQPLTTYR